MALSTISPDNIAVDHFSEVLLSIMSPGWRIDIPEPGFLVGPLNMNNLFKDAIVEHYPEVFCPDGSEWATAYFVDDSPQAVIDRLKPVLTEADGTYLVTITEFRKEDEESSGGWRWHKWGPYLGKKNPQCEYLYDEPEIDKAVVAHIFEVER